MKNRNNCTYITGFKIFRILGNIAIKNCYKILNIINYLKLVFDRKWYTPEYLQSANKYFIKFCLNPPSVPIL